MISEKNIGGRWIYTCTCGQSWTYSHKKRIDRIKCNHKVASGAVSERPNCVNILEYVATIPGGGIDCGCSELTLLRCGKHKEPVTLEAIPAAFHGVIKEWSSKAKEYAGRSCNVCVDYSTDEFRWITRRDFTNAVEILATKVPPDVIAVAGVPRSGMLAACDISIRLSLPLLSIGQNGLIQLSNGHRLRRHHIPKAGRLLIVEDSTNSGTSLANAVKAARRPNALTAVLFHNPKSKFRPNIIIENTNMPHLFEWHFFSSRYSLDTGFDIDGVLFREVKPHGPLYIPRWMKVPLIATGRLERHRTGTERWLRNWNIEFDNLVMWQGDECPEQHLGVHKAEAYRDSECKWFVESSPRQAKLILEIAHKPVICPKLGKVFQ